MRISASAPGSLMLFGEHAVLHGQTALCASVDQRIEVSLSSRADREVHIHSSLGTLQTTLDALEPRDPFTFLLRSLQVAPPEQGVDLNIRADFGDRVGLGSSAAVTVAALGALHALRGKSIDPHAIFLEARAVIRSVQGRGSGADAAAATLGGIVKYRAAPLVLESYQGPTPPVSLLYAGYKTKTPDVIAHVDTLASAHPDATQALYEMMGTIGEQAFDCLRQHDMEHLGKLMNLHHGLQDALGTCDATLAHLVYSLRQQPAVQGAKISGSGLGDCVLASGDSTAQVDGYQHIPVQLGGPGLLIESHD